MSRTISSPRAALSGYRSVIARLPPSYFSLVMATGIVVIAIDTRGMDDLALALGWFDVICYAVLVVLHALRVFYFPRRALADLVSHRRGPGYFTWVAGTSVLGSQFLYTHDNVGPAFVLWLIAVVLWLILTYAIFTAFVIKSHKPSLAAGINGQWLLAVVAAQSIAVLAAPLAVSDAYSYSLVLNFVALAFWLWGGMLYIWLIILIFYRLIFFCLAPQEITPAFWISMGAMAISTLAGAALVISTPTAPYLDSMRPFLEGITILYWVTGTFWLPLLISISIWRHFFRGVPFRYHSGNWGAVFPLGMYSVATYTLSIAMPLDFLIWIGDLFLVAAVLAWLLNIIGLGRRLWQIAT